MRASELGEQLVEIVNVPRTLDLRQHDNIQFVADSCDDLEKIVQNPRTVEAVDARPKPGSGEIRVARHLDEAVAGRDLLIGGNGIFEVAEHDVDLAGEIGNLGADFFDVRRYEMDHPLKPDRRLGEGLRRVNGERLEERLR